MRALLIDDSRAQRSVIRGMLSEFGFDVVEAKDGKEGLARLSSPVPDLAVVDWNMPEMNGLAFVQAARQRAELASMPILMATTETEMSQVAVALEAGANEYLMKPFPKDALREKLVLLGVIS